MKSDTMQVICHKSREPIYVGALMNLNIGGLDWKEMKLLF